MKGGTEMFLVKQAQRGDADAFVALIEKYKMDLYKVAKACLKNEEDVADAGDDTFGVGTHKRAEKGSLF